jgi:ribosomal protein L29
MPESHRDKIKIGNIITALQQHLEGVREMSATQIQAANILLRKVMPDLSSQQLTGDKDNPVHQVSRIERDIVDPMPVPSPTEVARVH